MAYKAKQNNWLNMNTKKVTFGFDVFLDGKWHHAGDSDGLFQFDTKAERDKALVEYRKIGAYQKK